MSGLPWVRLDTNCFSHDKTLWLIDQRDGYRAWAVYTFGLAYAGGHGTDKIAQLLVEARLWEYAEGGWQIRNWEQRQELAVITDAKREAARLGGRKRSCQRYHGDGCQCWKESDAEILPIRRQRG